CGRGLVRGTAGSAQPLLHPLEAALELAIRLLQRRFRVQRKITGDIDQHKEKVSDIILEAGAEFIAHLRAPGPGNAAAWRRNRNSLQLFSQFAGFFVELVEEAFDMRPVKTDAARAGTELVSFQEGRHSAGNSRQD